MADLQTIYTSAGAVEYTWPVTVTADHDISTDVVRLSLGDRSAPGTWMTPDILSRTGDVATAQLLVGGNYQPAADFYWLWVKVTDSPEAPIRRADLCIRVV